ncbi:unnamed protein product [Schistosoma curassoni]|nr:unnamed protein product [Schistosoma curassoni]
MLALLLRVVRRLCILSAFSPNKTMSSAYSKSTSEPPGRSSTPGNLDEESVISKSTSTTKLNKNGESGQP